MRFIITPVIPLLLSASVAWAQDAVVEGPGVAVGEGARLHVNGGVEAGFDSNVFYADGAVEPGVVAAPILRVMGNAAIASEHNKPRTNKDSVLSVEDADSTITGEPVDLDQPKPDWDFRFAVELGYNQYIGIGHSAPNVDINYAISQQSNLSGILDAHVQSNPHGKFSFFADNILVRDNRPRNFVSSGLLGRWNNDFHIGARYRPYGGALKFSLRYENMIDRFDRKVIVPNAQLANRINHLVRGTASWQFLPITRFYFDGSYGLFGPLGNEFQEKVRSTPLRLQLGVATLITETTSVRAHVGFGKGFYVAGPDFTMAIFGAEFGWRYSAVGRLTFAYEYDFRDSINANFYRDHALVAKVDHQIERVLLDFGAQMRLRGYRGVFASVGPPNRDDLILGARAMAHYLTRDWLSFNAMLDVAVDSTAYRDFQGDDPSFTRVEFILGANAAY